MAIIPPCSNGQRKQPRCVARETYDEMKGQYRGNSLRPVCPALREILKERAKGSGPAVLGAAVALADRMYCVLNACGDLTKCPPTLEVVALWAHGGDLRAGVAPVVDDLVVLGKQLQRDCPLSARKLEDLSKELDLATATYELNRARDGFVYLEPDQFARDHWRGFRLWRNGQVEAAELGGGRLGRIQMARLTSTYPVDVVSLASDIIEELAPIARDIADKAARLEAEQKSNEPGQAGETSIEHIQLENGAYKILHMLGSSPTRLQQEDLTLCEDPPMDRRTVSRHLKTLKEHGLVDYNPRDKKGAAITPKGRDYLNSQPK
jgi:hypothetical protein